MKSILNLFISLVFVTIFSLNLNSQNISTFAGNGSPGFSGDGGAATSAQLYYNYAIAFDGVGNLYVADNFNERIRKITPLGIITTICGTGIGGFSGDGGAATLAEVNYVVGLAIDNDGNIFINDRLNYRIRKINTLGIISTYAGTGLAGYSGDGGAATSAQISVVAGLTTDAVGNLYLADQGNHRIRKVTPLGIISTYAGTGAAGFSGDGSAATSAQLNQPFGVTMDANNNLYIADYINNRIRVVNNAGIISTFAGNGSAGFSGDGGAATSAMLNGATGTEKDVSGNVYIADYSNHRVRKVNQAGTISTICGAGPGFFGDGGLAISALLNYPHLVALDPTGNIYISDRQNHRIRKISCIQPTITASSSNSAICSGQSATLSANGGVTYMWTPSGNGASLAITPSVSSNYTVTGTNSVTGCSASTTITQSVSPNPPVSASSSTNIICAGHTVALSASGANNYTWNPGGVGGTITVSPVVTTTYVVSGTSTVTGCSASAVLVQSVVICSGIETNLIEQNFSLKVYPNPSINEFIIYSEIDILLSITNELGQLVKTISLSEANHHQVKLNNLSNGIYFINGNTGAQTVRKKIVVFQ